MDKVEQAVADAEAEELERANSAAAVKAVTGSAGTLITTPIPTFSGRTAGISFVDGKAFVPDSWPNAAKLVRDLHDKFGYSVSRVTALEAAELRMAPDMPLPPKVVTDDRLLYGPGFRGEAKR